MTALAYKELAIAFGFLAWCAGLLGTRLVWTGHWAFMFLAWNLFLATLPFAMSLAIRQRPRAPLCLLLVPAWLLSLGYAAIALLGGETPIGATPTTASNAMNLEPKAAEASR